MRTWWFVVFVPVLAGTGFLALRTDAVVAPAAAQTATRGRAYAAPFQRPRAIAVDARGRAFVLDMTSRVYRFAGDGALEASWQVPDQTTGSPSGLFVDHENRVWVADTHNHRVLVYDDGGAPRFQFGSLGPGPGEFLFPTDVVVLDAAPGEPAVYVCEYGGNDRVSAFDSELRFLFDFGSRADPACALSAPYALCAGREADSLWVADTGNHRLCEFARDGKFLRSVGGPGDPAVDLRHPADVTLFVGAAGDPLLVTACRQSNQVVAVAPVLGTSLRWGVAGRGAGCVSGPQGLALLPSGDLLLANTDRHEVLRVAFQEWTGGGRATPLAEGSR